MTDVEVFSAASGMVNWRDPAGFRYPYRPPRPSSAPPLPVMTGLRLIFSRRTFILMVLQGVFGEMPWVAFGTFGTLYLQYIGFSDSAVAAMIAIRTVGGGLGTLLGGWLGDRAHRASPDHGHGGGRGFCGSRHPDDGGGATPGATDGRHDWLCALQRRAIHFRAGRGPRGTSPSASLSFVAKPSLGASVGSPPQPPPMQMWTPVSTIRPVLCEICKPQVALPSTPVDRQLLPTTIAHATDGSCSSGLLSSDSGSGLRVLPQPSSRQSWRIWPKTSSDVTTPATDFSLQLPP